MKRIVKKDAMLRLARMAGQVAGLSRMVEEDRYCVDILTQVAALRGALENFGAIVLSSHIEDCVYGNADGAFADATVEERIAEVRTALERYLK